MTSWQWGNLEYTTLTAWSNFLWPIPIRKESDVLGSWEFQWDIQEDLPKFTKKRKSIYKKSHHDINSKKKTNRIFYQTTKLDVINTIKWQSYSTRWDTSLDLKRLKDLISRWLILQWVWVRHGDTPLWTLLLEDRGRKCFMNSSKLYDSQD